MKVLSEGRSRKPGVMQSWAEWAMFAGLCLLALTVWLAAIWWAFK